MPLPKYSVDRHTKKGDQGDRYTMDTLTVTLLYNSNIINIIRGQFEYSSSLRFF